MSADLLLIDRIRATDEAAWNELIARYEGRLLAFVESRLKRRDSAEDIVQETFIGFLTSLPNFDSTQSLESYLFSIAAHKMTDHMRREGRRPTLPLSVGKSSGGEWNLPANERTASAICRSGERRALESTALAAAMREHVNRWRTRGEWWKIQCVELLFVRGRANKDVADRLGISEQQVANQKFDFIARMNALLARQDLSPDIFPELNSGGA
ncbi:MAG: RNA polymerase sigma factor [Pirellulales bacterium]|nr:RNA polymerase sigma factor [Pirellulales bacterium]